MMLKIQKLVLYLEYQLIDICYMTTKKHHHKYIISEEVRADLEDPIFNIKREFFNLFNLLKYDYEYILLA